MTKKRIIVICAVTLLFVMLCAGTTYALLVSRSHSIINTFVSGDIELTLTESTGSKYTLVPGCTIDKDPRITVKEGSEECWLFFRTEGYDDVNLFVNYSVADGWTALSGEEHVWWRRVSKCTDDKVYTLLKNNEITVSENVTEEMLESVQSDLKLTFFAYAIQYEGISTPEKAWDVIKSKEVEA